MNGMGFGFGSKNKVGFLKKKKRRGDILDIGDDIMNMKLDGSG